jgi:hypothetical protein
MNQNTKNLNLINQSMDEYNTVIDVAIDNTTTLSNIYNTYIANIESLNKTTNKTINNYNVMFNVIEKMEVNPFGKAEKGLEQVEVACKKLEKPLDQAEGGQEKVNTMMEKGKEKADALVNKMKKFAGSFLNFKDIKKGFESIIVGALDIEKQVNSLQNAFGNKDIGKGYFEALEKRAQKSAFTLEEYGANTNQLLSFTKNTEQLDRLNDLSEVLAAATPNKGLTDVGEALSKAANGDFKALEESFNIPASAIEASGIKTAESTDDFINKMEDLLGSMNLDASTFEEFNNLGSSQITMLTSNIKDAFSMAGMGALEAFTPFLMMLNDFFTSGSLDSFFQALEFGVSLVMNVLVGVGEQILNIASFISENWSTIEPFIWGIVAAMGAWILATQGLTLATKIQIAVTTAVALAQKLLNAIMNANPFVLIITVVVGLIAWLCKLWQTNDNFAAAIKRGWNSILNFFDQVPIFYAKLASKVISIFLDMATGALGALESLVNGVISGINFMIDKLNKIPGVNISAVGAVDFTTKSNLKAEAIKQATDNVVTELEIRASNNAAEREQKVLDFLAEREAKRAVDDTTKAVDEYSEYESSWNNNVEDGFKNLSQQLDTDGVKVKDTVDISSEDIEYMRELAEQEAINRFTSATLAPQLSVQFGDVKETADVNGIVTRLENIMLEQLAVAAEGVHS